MYEIMSSISERVANRASHDVIPRIMQWSCTYSLGLKVIESHVFGSQMGCLGFFCSSTFTLGFKV